MKLPLCALALLTASLCHADRLFQVPTGKKIPFGTIRLEHIFEGGDKSQSETLLGIGISTTLDMEIGFDSLHQSGQEFVLDLAYNFVDPITNYGPGLSVGVQDIWGRTGRGRRYFVAATWRLGMYGTFVSPMEFTLGYEAGDIWRSIIGVLYPFNDILKLVAEAEGTDITGGLEFKPVRPASVRWLHRQGEVLWSVSWTQKF